MTWLAVCARVISGGWAAGCHHSCVTDRGDRRHQSRCDVVTTAGCFVARIWDLGAPGLSFGGCRWGLGIPAKSETWLSLERVIHTTHNDPSSRLGCGIVGRRRPVVEIAARSRDPSRPPIRNRLRKDRIRAARATHSGRHRLRLPLGVGHGRDVLHDHRPATRRQRCVSAHHEPPTATDAAQPPHAVVPGPGTSPTFPKWRGTAPKRRRPSGAELTLTSRSGPVSTLQTAPTARPGCAPS